MEGVKMLPCILYSGNGTSGDLGMGREGIGAG